MPEWLKLTLAVVGGGVLGAALLYGLFWVVVVRDFSKWW